MAEPRLPRLAAHLLFFVVVVGVWELAAARAWLNPVFFGRPSGVAAFLWQNLAVNGGLWRDLGWTLLSTWLAFAAGTVLALLVGLVFALLPPLQAFLDPYLTALNAIPRIALAPLFILWFGLGIVSKVAVGATLVFFIVLAAMVAGMRGVDPDHVTMARTFGATPAKMLVGVVLPGAVPVVFAGLRLALIFAMVGVVGSEIIASEHGLGQRLAYLSATFDINGVFGVLALMAMLGVATTEAMNWLERRLLAWR